MQHHRIFVYAANHDGIAAAAKDAHAFGHESFSFGTIAVGYIDSFSLGTRRALRSDNRVGVLPNRHSQSNDISKCATAMGIPNAKTARDLFSAVFAATDLDVFDPDL